MDIKGQYLEYIENITQPKNHPANMFMMRGDIPSNSVVGVVRFLGRIFNLI